MASTSAQKNIAEPGAPKGPSRLRYAAYGLIAILALIVLVIIWNFSAIKSYGEVGTGYAARVVCSCRYVGGRSLGDCEKDLEPGMEIVGLSDDPDAKRVTATALLLAENQAEFREGFGCVLLSEAERKALEE
jgi:hypothetical protein